MANPMQPTSPHRPNLLLPWPAAPHTPALAIHLRARNCYSCTFLRVLTHRTNVPPTFVRPACAGAALALLCLSLAQVLGLDGAEACPEPCPAEAAEVVGHSLKDRPEADVVPWALLAALYRNQGVLL